MGLLLRMLVRDWRGGELGVLLAALVLAVAMVSGISGFAGALKSALRQESHSFLAADIAVRASSTLPGAWLEAAAERELETGETITFSSMLFAGDSAMTLSSVKAVSDAYPLRGTLRLSATPFGELREHRGAPERGTVWLEPRLFPLLMLAVGDTVSIGEADFVVAGALRGEPDRAGDFSG